MARTVGARDRAQELPDHPDQERLLSQLVHELPPLVRPSRLAVLFDMERQRVYDLVASGALAAITIGPRGIRIYRESIAEWLRRGGK